MAISQDFQAPETLDGWFVLTDVYVMDWPAWRAAENDRREAIVASAMEWWGEIGRQEGHSSIYSLLTQKGDLMFLHFRRTPDELNGVELSLRQTPFFDYLRPAYSFLSVVELSMYELTAEVLKKLEGQGIVPGTEEYEELLDTEMAKQKNRVEARLYPSVPPARYVCFYPMRKRRGESVNWYTLSVAQRREMMRGHGRIGHKFHEQVTQIVSGAMGLDDWEWGVSLFADDALAIKKLVYEMRFDPASAQYAEFGPFYMGIRFLPGQLSTWLEGRVPDTLSSPQSMIAP